MVTTEELDAILGEETAQPAAPAPQVIDELPLDEEGELSYYETLAKDPNYTPEAIDLNRFTKAGKFDFEAAKKDPEFADAFKVSKFREENGINPQDPGTLAKVKEGLKSAWEFFRSPWEFTGNIRRQWQKGPEQEKGRTMNVLTAQTAEKGAESMTRGLLGLLPKGKTNHFAGDIAALKAKGYQPKEEGKIEVEDFVTKARRFGENKQLSEGRVLDTGIVAGGMKLASGLGSMAGGGGYVENKPSEMVESPEQLKERGTPLTEKDLTSVRAGAELLDPTNVLYPKLWQVPGVSQMTRAAGTAIEAVARKAPRAALSAMPPMVKKGVAIAGAAGGAAGLTYDLYNHPQHVPMIAAGAAAVLGARYAGRLGTLMREGGELGMGKMPFKEGVSSLRIGAAKAAPGVVGGGLFGAAAAEDGNRLQGGISGGIIGGILGGFSGGNKAIKAGAVTKAAADMGASIPVRSEFAAEHDSIMQQAPEWFSRRVNAMRGHFTTDASGPGVEVVVLSPETFQQKTGADAAGFYDGEARTIFLNYGSGDTALGHEAGHAAIDFLATTAGQADAQAMREVIKSKLSPAQMAEITNSYIDALARDRGVSREQMLSDLSAQAMRDQTTVEDLMAEEALAEQARKMLDSTDLGEFGLKKGVADKIMEGIKDHLRLNHGLKPMDGSDITKVEVREATKALRELFEAQGQKSAAYRKRTGDLESGKAEPTAPERIDQITRQLQAIAKNPQKTPAMVDEFNALIAEREKLQTGLAAMQPQRAAQNAPAPAQNATQQAPQAETAPPAPQNPRRAVAERLAQTYGITPEDAEQAMQIVEEETGPSPDPEEAFRKVGKAIEAIRAYEARQAQPQPPPEEVMTNERPQEERLQGREEEVTPGLAGVQPAPEPENGILIPREDAENQPGQLATINAQEPQTEAVPESRTEVAPEQLPAGDEAPGREGQPAPEVPTPESIAQRVAEYQKAAEAKAARARSPKAKEKALKDAKLEALKSLLPKTNFMPKGKQDDSWLKWPAVRFTDERGEVWEYSAPRHAEAEAKLVDALGYTPHYNEIKDGFVTYGGKFLNRNDAYKRAVETGQYAEGKDKGTELIAELVRGMAPREFNEDGSVKFMPKQADLAATRDEKTGEITYSGRINKANPLHAEILRHFGYNDEQIGYLEKLQDQLGEGVVIRDYQSAEQEGFDSGEGLAFDQQTRREAYDASPAPDRAEGAGAVTKQDKAFTPLGVTLKSTGLNVIGFDHDKLFSNVRAIMDAARESGVEVPNLSDKELLENFQTYSRNHRNGWKGDGSAKLQPFPDTGITPNPDYVGTKIPKEIADLLNMAVHIRAARTPVKPRGKTELALAKFQKASDKSKEAIGLNEINQGFLNLETKEVNPLRDRLEKAGFETDKILQPTLSNLRPDLMGGIAKERASEKNIHASGFESIKAGELSKFGLPESKIVAAGFMPKKASTSDNASDKVTTDEQRPTQPGRGRGRNGSPLRAAAAAGDYLDKYARQYGIEGEPIQGRAKIDPERSRATGEQYEGAANNPTDPEVVASYQRLGEEIEAQYQHAQEQGIRFEFTADDPYKSSAEMMADVEDNGRLRVFNGGSNHPLLGDSTRGEDGLSWNDKFRAVHDLYGHAADGNQFGPVGEERAWLKHAQMFSPEARRAMTTETRGQNSWVNYGPHMWGDDGGWKGDKNHPEYIPPGERPFADQKVFLFPPEMSEPKSALFMPKKAGLSNLKASDRINPDEKSPSTRRGGAATLAGIRPASERNRPGGLQEAGPGNVRDGRSRVKFRHWSNSAEKGLTLDPSYHGKGAIGEEKSRRRDYKEAYLDRTYIGLPGYTKESFLDGKHEHSGTIDKRLLYNLAKDPLDLIEMAWGEIANGKRYARFDKRAHQTIVERLVRDSGFMGYYDPYSKAAAVFHKIPANGDVDMAHFQKVAPQYAKKHPQFGKFMPSSRDTKMDEIVPAIKVGGKLIKGRKGDVHQDILNRYLADNPDDADALLEFDTKENPNLFVDGAGNEISRAQLKEQFGVSDSQGLKRLQGGSFMPKQAETPEFKRWFGDSKVVDSDGNPLVVFSGHSNAELYGNAYDPKKGTAGGFYATEDPQIASNYAVSKMGARETYERGSQYRFKLKNGKWGKKLWQIELNPEQVTKAREWLTGEDGVGQDLEAYWKENAPYGQEYRRRQARGLKDLQSIYDQMEEWAYTINYGDDASPGEFRPNAFERLMAHLGLEWQSFLKPQGGVMPVYLNIRNPLDASKPFPEDLLNYLKAETKGRRTSDAKENETHWTKEYPLKAWVRDIASGDEYWTTHIPKEAVPILKRFGYDGIKERGSKGAPDDKRQVNWIAFDPTQIKSATGNSGAFSQENPDMRFMPRKQDGLGFYSKLEETVEEKIPNKASGEQILATLDSAGVKKEESDWMGLPEFLANKPSVTKEELLTFIRDNQVEIQEKTLGYDKLEWDTESGDMAFLVNEDGKEMARATYNEDTREWSSFDPEDSEFIIAEGRNQDKVLEETKTYIRKQKQSKTTKFEDYKLPGGDNYREVLLTLPSSEGDVFLKEKGMSEKDFREGYGDALANAYINEWRAQKKINEFRSSHWDEPNVLVHIRQADHQDTEGRKVRLIEEIQSDFGQGLRKQDAHNKKQLDQSWVELVTRMKKDGILRVKCP